MSDQQFFRKYIDIINEESPVFQQRNNANAQKWAKENPEAAQYAKLAADVVTDYIPGVSQVKSAYRAGKAALGGDYGEAGKQLVGTFVPGGRRMVGAVDAGLDAAKGNYKGALSNLSYAAGGELGRAVSTGLAASDIAKAVVPNAPQSVPATQTAQSNTPAAEPDMSPTTGKYTPGPALQSLTKQASTTPTTPEPTTEEEELDENSRMRKYLDIIDEGPPPGVGPNAPTQKSAAPANQPLGGYDPKSGKAPTQQQADNLMGQIDAAGNQIIAGGEKMGAGNYASGAMDTARGVNNVLNAAGATTGDKLKMGWTGLKAGANAGLAYLRGKGEEGALAAATGTVGQELTQPMAKYAKSKNFDKDFNQAMSAPNANDPSMQKMQQDAQRNLITSNSMKNYMTGVDKTMGDLKSGDTTAYDRLNQQTMYRQDTMSPYLDISKKQALTGQQVQTPGELMGKEEPAAPQPTAPAAPAQQAAPAAPQPTQPQQTTEEELEEELQKILRLSGRKKETTNETDSFKKFYSILNESSEKTELTESIELHDSFDIELNEHFVIETGIIGFTEDGIIIEADETLLGLFEVNNIICEEETTQSKPDTKKKDKPSDDYIDTKPATDTNIDTSKLIDKEPLKAKPLKGDPKDYIVKEAEYQGRKVPLGKPMAGDVAKSKVYVKKPNGKVVKVNFGDKNMKIKKSNPNRRKSFRARHRCENPGPRWKARYWSCRAW